MGWQKFDLTHTIRKWYQEDSRTNLQLLIDCSGCGNRVEIKLFEPTLSASTTTIRGENVNRNVDDHTLNSNEKIHQKVLKHHILENGDSGRSKGGDSGKQNEFTVTEQIHRPFLVVHTDPNIMKRVRRRALDCSGAARGQCCKQRFFVSFKALGWDDWIIAPHGYFANYCRGDCGGAHRTPDTYLNYHTHIMQEFRKNEDKMKDEQKLNGMQPCCAPLKFSSMSLIYFGPDSNIIKRDLPKMVVDECGCP
jgi:inhibin beta B chain